MGAPRPRSDFFFSSRGRHTRCYRDWSSDVCSSDLPRPKQVLEEFTALTGRAPLPPLWALGYQQCRYSYYPEARVREVARTFREKRIPADVIYLDIDYQDGNRPFTIDRKRFPNFEGMIRDLGAQDFKVVAITDLHI